MPDQPTRSAEPDDATAQHANNATRDLGESTRDATQADDADGARPAALPGYEILERVGSGGMGLVYRARELAFDRDVAVKILQDRYPADSPAARRFLDEARITGQLQHPAIPPVHHIGTLADGRPFLVMKLIKGDTLSALLETEPARLGRYVAVFSQVCQGVGYAHSRGVIHRDLKPANVMVGAFDEVQVMDWGLAKVLTGQPKVAEPTEIQEEHTEIRTSRDAELVTQAGSVLGTPAYMAPEQAGGEVERIDSRADVFGLGAMLCTILTGRPPYSASNSDSIRVLAIRGETADAFARLDACGADPELVALCKRCLETDRDARPRDAGEVARAVSAHLTAAEERARQAELDRVRGEERRKRQRVRAALAVAVLGLLASVGLGLLVANLWQRAERGKETADYHRGQAEEEKKTADHHRGQAVEEKKIADGLRAEADSQRLKARQYLYYSRVGLASRAWNDGQVHRMGELLEQERAQAPREDLRGFEWHYLWRIHKADRYVLRGHTDAVRAASWRPDGKRLASGSRDGTVRIWDAETPGPAILILEGHTGDVHGVCWSPDGKQIASAATDLMVKIWDAETGKVIKTLTGPKNYLVSLAWSRDGERIASGSWDSTAWIWDTQTWDHVVCKGHTSNVEAVAFSPDGTRLATGSFDKTMKVWDARTGKLAFTSTGHTDAVKGVCWTPDGKRIASASLDHTIRLWDSDEGKELSTLNGHTHSVFRVCFDPDGKVLASASADSTVRLWDAATGKEQVVLRGHTALVPGLEFSPDGTRLASGSFDKTVRVWDVNADPDSLTLGGHSKWAWGVAFSPDGKSVASTGIDSTAKVWDVATGRERFPPLRHASPVVCVAYSPDGKFLVTGADDHTVKVWDAATGKDLRTLKGHRDRVYSVAFSPDGQYLVSSIGTYWYFPLAKRMASSEVKVWRVSDWQEVTTLKGHTGLVTGLSFSSDGKRLATSSYDQTVRVWDTATWLEIRSWKFTESWPSTLAFRPGGRELATGSPDGTLQTWDADTGRELKRFQGHTEDVMAIAYSPDGSRLVSASHDSSLKLWDPTVGHEVLTLKAHKTAVFSVAFSPDGKRLASGDANGVVRVWDATPLPDDR